MTSFLLRTEPAGPDTDADFLLDWFAGDPARSTVTFEPAFLRGTMPGSIAGDLLRVAGGVYCADKVASRRTAEDAWTRDIELTVPVSDVVRWEQVTRHLERTLRFLSGDRWTLHFVVLTPAPRPTSEPGTLLPADGVCLLSGGLDSLAGAINLLAADQRLVFVGHHDSAKADNRQAALYRPLAARFGDRVGELRRLYLRPHLTKTGPARPLPSGRDEVETTTRSRSFLFLAAAVAIAAGVGPGVPVYMPENGFIGINVPLTASRAGSLSTRTTHPLFMTQIERLMELLGLDHPIVNPFRLQTKGELLHDSADPKLLAALAPESVSCSHPEAARWAGGDEGGKQGNCGACFPCLIRRAALHSVGVGADDASAYRFDVFTRPELLEPGRDTGASLRAVLDALRRPDPPVEHVLVNGRIPGGDAPFFHAVHIRGRAELRAWLSSSSPPLL